MDSGLRLTFPTMMTAVRMQAATAENSLYQRDFSAATRKFPGLIGQQPIRRMAVFSPA
jgi:hypothetical protein